MTDEATAHAWAALGGRADLAGSVAYEAAGPVLPARLPVRELARATVGACSLAAAELLALRCSEPFRPVLVHEGAVAAAFVSERHLRVDGRSHPLFAPMSGFWRASDGWVRTHANYPHHRTRLLAALGIPDTGDDTALAETLREELATRPAESVQESVYEAGGLAVAVASAPSELRLPLVEVRRTGDGDPRPLRPAPLPAAGVRVLDLTRVIAGPVASRTLALLGADVLRLDSPRLPEDAMSHADTGMGKRSALVDLADPGDRAVFEDLLGTADVVLTGYRPGALDRHGLAPDALSARRPDLIVGRLRAWDRSGPWAARRGFDSLVQAASGIAAVEAAADGTPGVLPAQALDHGTGYLLAAAVLRALSGRYTHGGGRHLSLSLRGTASWLLNGVRAEPAGDGDPAPEPWLTRTASPYGTLDHAVSPLGYEGAPRTWGRPPSRWGADRPEWL